MIMFRSVRLGVAFLVLAFLARTGEQLEAQGNREYAGQLVIATTPDAASLGDGIVIENFPLLVRLNSDFFDFQQAAVDGSDLRFSTSSGEPLACEVENWDAQGGEASVWVRVPRIEGNRRQTLNVTWGPKAKDEKLAVGSVFDRSNGYLVVSHMGASLVDVTRQVRLEDRDTSVVSGVIGQGRKFQEGQGISGGEQIAGFPTRSEPHSTQAWVRVDRPNMTVVGWGIEKAQGKVVMQLRSPLHVRMDCYFSNADVRTKRQLPQQEWLHVVHTYEQGESRVYVNGQLEGETKSDGSPLTLQNPAKLWIGGWYGRYDFVGDMDEVRISNVKRSAEWIQLEYENQKPNQMLVGNVIRSGQSFEVTPSQIELNENQSATISLRSDGASKVVWTQVDEDGERIVATDRTKYTYRAGRISTPSEAVGKHHAKLRVQAWFADKVQSIEIPITVADTIPDPQIEMTSPLTWDGFTPLELVPRIVNQDALQQSGAEPTRYHWRVDQVATIRRVMPDKLVIQRALGHGPMTVRVTASNGGRPIEKKVVIAVDEPKNKNHPWQLRPLDRVERPVDHQVIPCEDLPNASNQFGRLVYRGQLEKPAGRAFLRVYADDKLVANKECLVDDAGGYSLVVPVEPKLVKYRSEFGQVVDGKEVILHRASDLVCGYVFLINGQSNAEATDIGPDDPDFSSDWIRSFGSASSDPNQARMDLWGNAVARDRNGGKLQIGFWGMELGKRIVAELKVPVCILNGAVGGTRIDQHQRNSANPTDPQTIYGRLLGRAQRAKLSHGVRAVIWHQGENDQGADGPTGKYGWETYRDYFVDLAAAWHEDYPNLKPIYMFQIWPKACAMGVDDSDDKLREVQRTMTRWFSNLSVYATLGIRPPGGCHYPQDGYIQFAKILDAPIRYQVFHRYVDGPYTSPNLQRAYFSSTARDEIVLEFDQIMNWKESLISEFYLDGVANQVESGGANAGQIILKLKGPTQASRVKYLDSDHWSQDRLLMGQSGQAALTFDDIVIEEPVVR